MANLTEERANAIAYAKHLASFIPPEPEPMLELLIVPFELLRVAEGHPNVCRLSDGREVRVRIPTYEEAREATELARASLGIPEQDDIPEAALRAMIKPLRLGAPAEALRRGMFDS